MGLQPLKGTRGAAWFDVWKGRTKRNRKKKEKERWRREKSMVIHGMAKLRPQRVQPGDTFFSDRWGPVALKPEADLWLPSSSSTTHLPPLVPVPLDLTRLRSLGHSQTSRATRPFSHNRLSSGHCNPGVTVISPLPHPNRQTADNSSTSTGVSKKPLLTGTSTEVWCSGLSHLKLLEMSFLRWTLCRLENIRPGLSASGPES